MSTAHTPGPWIQGWDENFPRQTVIIEQETNGRILAVVDDNDEQDKANARLIASAPELLEALNHAHNSLRTFRNVPKEEQEWTSFDDDVMEAIERAIAKAEGRA
jgi:hypothetical protein